MTKHLITIVKALLSGGLIWWVFSSIDLKTAWAELRNVTLFADCVALATVFGQILVASLRLQILIRLANRPASFLVVLDSVLIGSFFNQAMISFVGGDAMRIWRLNKGGLPVGIAARSVLYDRIFGFLGLIALIVLGIPILFSVIPDNRVHFAIVTLVCAAIFGCITLLGIQHIQDLLPRFKVTNFFIELSKTGSEILSSGKKFWLLLALSALMQLLNVLIVYSVGLGLGVQMSALHYFVLVPPVLFLSMMPISIAGWGVREGAMVAALSSVGVLASQSLALSIAYGLVNILASLPGGALWLIDRRSRAPELTAGKKAWE